MSWLMQKGGLSNLKSGDNGAAACVGACLDAARLGDSAGSWLGPLWPSQPTAIVFCNIMSMFGVLLGGR
jgi:hypothetical protein